MILNLTELEITEMLNNEMNENGQYIESVGGWAMSTLESEYCLHPQYDAIVAENYQRFASIAQKMWQ